MRKSIEKQHISTSRKLGVPLRALLGSVLVLGVLTGCSTTPSGVSDKPTMASEGLAMNQVDTENKISSLCNDVLMQSGSVSTGVTEYLSVQDEYSQDQITNLATIIGTALSETTNIQNEAETYRPASALEDKNDTLKKQIKAICKDLDAMKNALESGDKEAVNSIYKSYTSDLDVVRSLAS